MLASAQIHASSPRVHRGEVKCYINRWPAASQLRELATPQITFSHSSFLTPIYSLAHRSNRPVVLRGKGQS